MALKVVGSGLGRTGTKSLQTALNMLGVGPCYHMIEVFQHPEHVPLWIAAGAGKPDWDTLFASYHSAVDYPAAHYWRELAAHYPDAKVLHTVRDPEAWFASTQATIFSPQSPVSQADHPMRPFFASFAGPIVEHLHDRDFLIRHFLDHTEEVKRSIPPERLLVYEAGQGWEPLCQFLGVPVPDAPYPSENSRAEFIGRVTAAHGDPAEFARRLADR